MRWRLVAGTIGEMNDIHEEREEMLTISLILQTSRRHSYAAVTIAPPLTVHGYIAKKYP